MVAGFVLVAIGWCWQMAVVFSCLQCKFPSRKLTSINYIVWEDGFVLFNFNRNSKFTLTLIRNCDRCRIKMVQVNCWTIVFSYNYKQSWIYGSQIVAQNTPCVLAFCIFLWEPPYCEFVEIHTHYVVLPIFTNQCFSSAAQLGNFRWSEKSHKEHILYTNDWRFSLNKK